MREVESLVRAGKQISCTSAVDVQENGAIKGEVLQDCSSEGTPHLLIIALYANH